VALQNGHFIIVSHVGNVSFTSQFYLTNVLYSPTFHLILISVAKLCSSLIFSLHFSFDQCLVQENQSLKMIGLAKQVGGLYKYSLPTFVSNLVSSNSINKSWSIILIVNLVFSFLLMHYGTLDLAIYLILHYVKCLICILPLLLIIKLCVIFVIFPDTNIYFFLQVFLMLLQILR